LLVPNNKAQFLNTETIGKLNGDTTMSITVNTNVSAMTAQRYLNSATDGVNKSMERLSSGFKINSAKDDAAGLQISNRLTSQSRGLEVAVRNANDGISMAQTAEGAMNESTNILQRMRDLSLQSSNGSNTTADREAIQQEVGALNDELNRIAETTSFGGSRLLNGQFGTKSFQIGADSGEAVMLSLNNMRSDSASMGGTSYKAEAGRDANWVVNAENSELIVSFLNKAGEEKELTINAKTGDDIEQVATYINGQTDSINASVSENGELQIVTSNDKVQGEVTFGGSLANELNMGKAQAETVKILM
jgi:flagellin